MSCGQYVYRGVDKQRSMIPVSFLTIIANVIRGLLESEPMLWR